MGSNLTPPWGRRSTGLSDVVVVTNDHTQRSSAAIGAEDYNMYWKLRLDGLMSRSQGEQRQVKTTFLLFTQLWMYMHHACGQCSVRTRARDSDSS